MDDIISSIIISSTMDQNLFDVTKVMKRLDDWKTDVLILKAFLKLWRICE